MLLTDLISVDDFRGAFNDDHRLVDRLDRLKPILQFLKAATEEPEFPYYKNRNEIMEAWCFLLAHVDLAIERSTTSKK